MEGDNQNKQKEIYQDYIINQNLLTIHQLKNIADEGEKYHNLYHKNWLSPNHTLELYLFEYYYNKKEYNCTPFKMHEVYRRLAERYLETDDVIEALEALDKSLQWNPLDLDTIFAKANVYRSIQELDKYKELIMNCHPYCYTKSDIARYYRYLGYYYLETYLPKVAISLYHYSNLFYKSAMADKEIQFLEKAIGNEIVSLSINDKKNLILMEGIPLQVNGSTLTMLSEVAEIELNVGNKDYAKYLYLFHYQLTKDKNIESILKS